mgnify:CR=1 FL=1
MSVEAGLERCVVEISGHVLGVAVVDRQSAYFIATSHLAVQYDRRQFPTLSAAIRSLHKDLAPRVYASQRRPLKPLTKTFGQTQDKSKNI